jgi:SSS family solute:Na+ symporter
LDKQNALNFQLLGGVWILQTFPAIVFGLFTRWFHRWALLIGWAVGMVYGTVLAYGYCTACTTRPFANSLSVVPLLGDAGYIGLTAFVVNVVVAVVLTAVFRAANVGNGTDITSPGDYFADIDDPGVQARVSEEKPIH